MGGCVIAELLTVVSERPEFISLLLLVVVWHPANIHTAAAIQISSASLFLHWL